MVYSSCRDSHLKQQDEVEYGLTHTVDPIVYLPLAETQFSRHANSGSFLVLRQSFLHSRSILMCCNVLQAFEVDRSIDVGFLDRNCGIVGWLSRTECIVVSCSDYCCLEMPSDSDYLSRHGDCPCTAIDLEAQCPSLARFAIARATGLALDSRVKGLDHLSVSKHMGCLIWNFDSMKCSWFFERRSILQLGA